jgi:hypothetical protein
MVVFGGLGDLSRRRRRGLSLLWLWRSLPEVRYALASSGRVLRLARFRGVKCDGVRLSPLLVRQIGADVEGLA